MGGEHEIKAFGSPQVVHFCAVLLIAAIASTPRQSATSLGWCLTISALVALAYTIQVVMHARHQTGYKPVFEDWLWHAILPLTAYVSLLSAGVSIFWRPVPALYVVAAAALLLLYIGIHNAWDTAIYISSRKKEGVAMNEQPINPKEAAIDFVRSAASGKVREAYRKYAAPNFRHHNGFFKGDAE